MSGPKVVTIVTREEILATCRALLAALASAVERWEKVATRSGVIGEDEIEASRHRIFEISALLDNDKFLDLQKRVPMEIAFLDGDIARIAEKAAGVAAKDREHTRRSIAAARMLRTELTSRSLEVPEMLQKPESYARAQLDEAVARAFVKLAPPEAPETVTGRQKELAGFYGSGENRQTFSQWLSLVNIAHVDPLVLMLETKVDELRVLAPGEAERYSEKLPAVAAEQSSVRRALLADSLTLDIAATRRSVMERLRVRSELEALHAEAGVLDHGASSELEAEIAAALADGNAHAAELSARASAIRVSLARLKDETVSLQRRKALLEGLGALGYAVKEGMETAWIENGRVVLSGGKKPGYGVEIGGNPDVALQVRTVAFNSLDARNAQADIEAEESFCSEFAALEGNLRAAGSHVTVVKALGVGTSRVKHVEATPTEVVAGSANVDIARDASRSIYR